MELLQSLLIILSSLLLAECRWDSPENVKNREITKLLDTLLTGYNRHLRPDFAGPPVEVQTNILIRSVGPVSEEQMMFSMDCYFRQQWRDTRLSFNSTNGTDILRPSTKMLDLIWKPDTFFLNGQDSYVHKITYVNKFLRIYNDSRIYYSQRLTIKSTCPMMLRKYPLDTQMCPLFVATYGYDDSDLQLTWTESAVKKYKDITMAQFLLIEPINYSQKMMIDSQGNRTVLYVEFKLQREIGYYLLQIYLPCYLIVIISWVSFWINREATAARVTLGSTTLLTTCTIAITGREGIPKVSYSTALDVFLLMCFSFVFAALIEYAGVNYFTKTMQKEGPPPEIDSDEEEMSKPLLTAQRRSGQLNRDVNGHMGGAGGGGRGGGGSLGGESQSYKQRESCLTMLLHCLKGNAKYRSFKVNSKMGSSLSVSKIDTLARIVFPLSFTCLNIIYWVGFLDYFNG